MIGNLLQITSIPISIEINITPAKLSLPDNVQKPEMEVTQTQGEFKIKSMPAKINIDTYQSRASMGYGQYNIQDLAKTEANKGIRIAYAATAKIVNDGDALMNGMTPSQIVRDDVKKEGIVDSYFEFIPKTGADLTFHDGILSINYEASELNIDWNNLQYSKLEFTPGTIEFIVKERPRVEIEYIGEPLYFPPLEELGEKKVLDVLG